MRSLCTMNIFSIIPTFLFQKYFFMIPFQEKKGALAAPSLKTFEANNIVSLNRTSFQAHNIKIISSAAQRIISFQAQRVISFMHNT